MGCMPCVCFSISVFHLGSVMVCFALFAFCLACFGHASWHVSAADGEVIAAGDAGCGCVSRGRCGLLGHSCVASSLLRGMWLLVAMRGGLVFVSSGSYGAWSGVGAACLAFHAWLAIIWIIFVFLAGVCLCFCICNVVSLGWVFRWIHQLLRLQFFKSFQMLLVVYVSSAELW